MKRFLGMLSTGRKIARGYRAVVAINDAYEGVTSAIDICKDLKETCEQIREESVIDSVIEEYLKGKI